MIMEHYNSLNVLPFYEDLKYQNGKKWYAYGSVFPLISRNDAVIPFQLIVQDDIASVISFSVVDAKSGSEVYSELTKPEIINKFSSLGYSVIKLKETAFPGSYTLKSGTYYLILKLQGSSKQYTYYSEVFVACDSVENYLKITYWNDDNIYYTGGEINYEGDFKFVCYIQATIGKPEYDFEEELTKRGGYPFLESQISSKTYKFKFIAPEFLCDGLRLVRLSDYIQISENGRNYNALTFAYEPEWQAQGDLASVEAEFTVDNIIQKIASFNRRVKESFYNALLVDVNTPLGFDDESIAQYYKSYIQGSGVSNLVNGLLIRELEELKEYKDNYYAVLDTGEGAAKKILLSNLLAGIGENIDTSNFVTTDATEQNVLGVKNFNAGITIGSSKIKAYEKDGCLFIDGNLALTGGLTMYAAGTQGVGSIYDGLPIDNDTIYWEIVDGSKVLKAKGGGGEAGSVQWGNISGKPTWIGDTKPTYNWSEIQGEKPFYTKEEIAEKYVTIDTEQEISGLKHFTPGLSVGKSKKKIYEEEGVVYIDADVAVTGGMTFYATAGRSVSTIMDAVAVDGITIKKENNVLKAVAGAGSSFDENAMWVALATSDSEKQIDKSHITTALTGFATESWVSQNYATASALASVSNKLNDFLEGSDTDEIINKWKELEAFLSGMAETDNLAEILETKADKKYVDSTFVTLGTKQTITGEKTFSSVLNTAAIKASGAITAPSLAASDWVTIAGIKLRKLEDGALILEGNLALTGALTMYATGAQGFDTIYDGLPIDNDTIYWSEVEGSKVLKAREGSGSSFDKSAMWTALAGSTTEQINKSHLTTALTGYATESWVTSKNYLTSVSIATISDLHANWDALLKAAPSAYVTRWPSFVEVTSKPTTLAGYGITDAPTKTGSGASGTWGIGITGNAATASKWATARTITLGSYLSGSVSLDGSANVTLNANVVGLTFQGNKTAATGNTSPASGVRLYQVYNNGYPTPYGNLLSVNGGGAGELLLSWNNANRIYYRSLRDNGDNWLGWNELAFITDNVASATKLQTARTLWGQSFNGTQNVSGDMSNVGNINTNFAHVNAKTFAYNPADAHDNGYPWYGFTYGGDSKIHISGYAGILFYTSAGNVLTLASDARVYANSYVANDWFRSQGDSGWYSIRGGGGWYMSDTYFIRSYGEKSVYLGNGSYRNGGGGYIANNLNNASDIYSCRFMSEGVGAIPAGNIRNILGWYDSAASGWQTSYIIGCVRNYNNSWGEMRLGVYQYEGSNRAAKMFISLDGANNHLYVEGNLLVTGGVTLYGSDIRYKSIIQQVKLSLLDIAKAPSFVYHWNREGMKCDRLNLGGSAQYTQSVLPWAVEEKDNFLSMDYATVAYTFAVHTARHLLTYETRTDKKIKKLEREIVILKKLLKKLGYEEVRTLDDQ
jgi:hypothetical protein